MRVLAEFIMRGRVQAAVVALIGSWFPLISPATVALVTLRRGAADGFLIFLWAMLPGLVALYISDVGALMPLVTIAGLLVTYCAAFALRNGAWEVVLLMLAGLSTLAALVLGWAVPDPVRSVADALGEMMQDIQPVEGGQVSGPSPVFVLGICAYVLTFSSLLSLLVGRWWQAMLYNPGGLQHEFHRLKLPLPMAMVCAAALFYCVYRGGDYQIWANVFSMPLLIVGIAIVHCAVKGQKLNRGWLVIFYVSLLLINALIILLAMLAVVDLKFDLRKRWLGLPKVSETENRSDQ